MKSIVTTFIAIVASLAITGCNNKKSSPSDDTPINSGIDLRVVSYNAWQGGANVNDGINKSIYWLMQQQPDIIAIQEGSEVAQTYASYLEQESGETWYVFNPAAATDKKNRAHSTAILSRFPIVEGFTTVGSEEFYRSSEGARIKLSDEQEVIVWSAHLSSTDYNAVKSACSWNPDRLAKSANYRITEINKIIEVMKNNGDWDNVDNTPIIIAGDFNASSHLDWTERAVKGQVVPCQRDFGESLYMEQQGFIDSYREINRDEIAHTGASWGVPIGKAGPNTSYVASRIDFIYYKGSNMLASDAYLFGQNWLDIPDPTNYRDNFYPSDHYGFVSQFKIDKPSNVTSALEPVDHNTQIEVTYIYRDLISVALDTEPEQIEGLDKPFIGLFNKAQIPSVDNYGIFNNAIQAQYLDGSKEYHLVPATDLAPGEYEIRVYRKDRTHDGSPLQTGSKIIQVT